MSAAGLRSKPRPNADVLRAASLSMMLTAWCAYAWNEIVPATSMSRCRLTLNMQCPVSSDALAPCMPVNYAKQVRNAWACHRLGRAPQLQAQSFAMQTCQVLSGSCLAAAAAVHSFGKGTPGRSLHAHHALYLDIHAKLSDLLTSSVYQLFVFLITLFMRLLFDCLFHNLFIDLLASLFVQYHLLIHCVFGHLVDMFAC